MKKYTAAGKILNKNIDKELHSIQLHQWKNSMRKINNF